VVQNNSEPNGDFKDTQAVIFDLGGVILRTIDSAPRMQLAERLGKTRWELEEIVFANPVSQMAENGRATPEDVWEYVRQSLNLKPEEVRPFRRAFFGGDRVDFELVRVLQSLRPAYRTGLLSNGWFVDLERFLTEDLAIPQGTFDVVVSSARLGMAKPRPEIYLAAVNLLGVEPWQAVFVDDNDLNIDAARKVGLKTIRFYTPQQALQELRLYVNFP